MSKAQETLTSVLEGDPDAIRSFVQELRPVIHARVARVLLRGRAASKDIREEIQDLIQEVFVSLFDSNALVLRSWDPSRGLSLKNFIGLVAERHTSSFLRSGKRSGYKEEATHDDVLALHAEQAPEQQLPDDLLASKEILGELLKRMHEELTPHNVQLFRLMWVEECSVSQVCKQLDMTPNAVYSLRSRLIDRLEKIYKKILQDKGLTARNCIM